MSRVKGGKITVTYDSTKRQPLDSRMLVTKRADLINPTIWITNTLTTDATYNGMIVAVNSDGEYNGVYYLTNRTAITADNYEAYQNALAAGEDVSSYFPKWTKLGTLDDLDAVLVELDRVKAQIGVVPEGKTLVDLINSSTSISGLTPVDGTIIINNTEDGGKAIGVAISEKDGNTLVAVDGGLFVQSVLPGNGIEIIDNKASVKLANDAHGLIAVDGALTLNLATKDNDGAMSKEDKIALDAVIEDVAEIKDTIADMGDGYTWGEI